MTKIIYVEEDELYPYYRFVDDIQEINQNIYLRRLTVTEEEEKFIEETLDNFRKMQSLLEERYLEQNEE